jgi:hypothetical protein
MPTPLRHVMLLRRLGPLPETDISRLNSIDWDAISKILGKKLSSEAQEQILFITTFYVLFSRAGKAAVPIKRLIVKLRQLTKVAEVVRSIFSDDPIPQILVDQKSQSKQSFGQEKLKAIEKQYFRIPVSKPGFYEDAIYPLLLHAVEA